MHAYKLVEISSMLTLYQAENGYRFFRAASLSDLLPIGTYRHPSWLTRSPGRQFQLSNTNLGFCIPWTIRFQSIGSLPGDDDDGNGWAGRCSSLSGVKRRPASSPALHGVELPWSVIWNSSQSMAITTASAPSHASYAVVQIRVRACSASDDDASSVRMLVDGTMGS